MRAYNFAAMGVTSQNFSTWLAASQVWHCHRT